MTKRARSRCHVMEILWIWVKDVWFHPDELSWPSEVLQYVCYWITVPFSQERSPVSKVSWRLSPQILHLSGTCWLNLLLPASLSVAEPGSGGVIGFFSTFVGQHFLYDRQYMSNTSLMLSGIWLIHCDEEGPLYTRPSHPNLLWWRGPLYSPKSEFLDKLNILKYNKFKS